MTVALLLCTVLAASHPAMRSTLCALSSAVLLLAVACGDITANTISRGDARPASSVDAGASPAASNCAIGSLEFRSLLLIKSEAHVAGVDYALSQTEVDEASAGFINTLPDWVFKISSGRVCFAPEVVVSPTPLTSFTDTCGGPTPWMDDVAAELQQLAPAGKYDTFYVYAPNGGSAGSCAYWPTASSNDAAFAYLDPPGEGAWIDPNNYIYEHAIWAWLIGMRGFYRGLSGVEPPALPDPSNGADYGYARGQAPFSGYMTWYGDLLKRAVMQNGVASGFGEPAWAHGTIRAAAPP